MHTPSLTTPSPTSSPLHLSLPARLFTSTLPPLSLPLRIIFFESFALFFNPTLSPALTLKLAHKLPLTPSLPSSPSLSPRLQSAPRAVLKYRTFPETYSSLRPSIENQTLLSLVLPSFLLIP